MRVKLKVHMSGTRNGAAWPPQHAEMDLPDEEAMNMIAVGMAEPVSKHKDAEKAVPEKAESRAEKPAEKPKASSRAAVTPKRMMKGGAKK